MLFLSNEFSKIFEDFRWLKTKESPRIPSDSVRVKKEKNDLVSSAEIFKALKRGSWESIQLLVMQISFQMEVTR